LRMASLCNEIAAVKIDATAPARSLSIEDGGLFKVIPTSPAGKAYADRLFVLSMLYLFGHEYAHVIGGHCHYVERLNYRVMPTDRIALELDADIVGGHAAGGWLVHNDKILELIGYPIASNPLAQQQKLIEDSVLGALIVYILFKQFSVPSNLYFDPPTRMISFVGGLTGYIEVSTKLPNSPIITIDPKYLSNAFVQKSHQNWMAFLTKTSIAPALNWIIGSQDPQLLTQTADHRDYLKDNILQELRPFGLPQLFPQKRSPRHQE
jgi:hypothetical protein